MYEPQETAVMVLERKLAAHRREMAAVGLSQQQQQQQQGDTESGSRKVAFGGSADKLGRVATGGRSPREQELYRYLGVVVWGRGMGTGLRCAVVLNLSF